MSKEHVYAYEAGYRDGAINYELDHCPACKNVADLQEALDENAKLRELVLFIMHQCNDGNPRCDECIDWNGGECVVLTRMRGMGVEVREVGPWKELPHGGTVAESYICPAEEGSVCPIPRASVIFEGQKLTFDAEDSERFAKLLERHLRKLAGLEVGK